MSKLLLKICHMFAHLCSWNFGHVETWYEGEKLMVGFKCDTCGKMTGIHESYLSKIKRRGNEQGKNKIQSSDTR